MQTSANVAKAQRLKVTQCLKALSGDVWGVYLLVIDEMIGPGFCFSNPDGIKGHYGHKFHFPIWPTIARESYWSAEVRNVNESVGHLHTIDCSCHRVTLALSEGFVIVSLQV